MNNPKAHTNISSLTIGENSEKIQLLTNTKHSAHVIPISQHLLYVHWLQFQSKLSLNFNLLCVHTLCICSYVSINTDKKDNNSNNTVKKKKTKFTHQAAHMYVFRCWYKCCGVDCYRSRSDLFLPDHVSGGVQQLAIFIHIALNHQVAVGVMGWEVVSHHSAGDTQRSRHWGQLPRNVAHLFMQTSELHYQCII